MRTNFNFHEWMISLLAIKEMYKKLSKIKIDTRFGYKCTKKKFLSLSYALTPGIGSIIEERMTVTRLISNATRTFNFTTNDSGSDCS